LELVEVEAGRRKEEEEEEEETTAAGVVRTHLVELEDVGAEADAVALVDADVAGHPAERGPGAARERHVPRLVAELHQAPALAGLGEPQAEVGREVEAGAERPHHLVHHLHHTDDDTPPPPLPLLLLLLLLLLLFYLGKMRRGQQLRSTDDDDEAAAAAPNHRRSATCLSLSLSLQFNGMKRERRR
jgi:MYXO-CTERM domain-containing protein